MRHRRHLFGEVAFNPSWLFLDAAQSPDGGAGQGDLVSGRSSFRYRRLHVLLGREGEQVNHKRVHRIYREAGLALRRKKRKHCVRLSTPQGIYTEANQEWALDFVHDAVASGRSIVRVRGNPWLTGLCRRDRLLRQTGGVGCRGKAGQRLDGSIGQTGQHVG